MASDAVSQVSNTFESFEDLQSHRPGDPCLWMTMSNKDQRVSFVKYDDGDDLTVYKIKGDLNEEFRKKEKLCDMLQKRFDVAYADHPEFLPLLQTEFAELFREHSSIRRGRCKHTRVLTLVTQQDYVVKIENREPHGVAPYATRLRLQKTSPNDRYSRKCAEDIKGIHWAEITKLSNTDEFHKTTRCCPGERLWFRGTLNEHEKLTMPIGCFEDRSLRQEFDFEVQDYVTETKDWTAYYNRFMSLDPRKTKSCALTRLQQGQQNMQQAQQWGCVNCKHDGRGCANCRAPVKPIMYMPPPFPEEPTPVTPAVNTAGAVRWDDIDLSLLDLDNTYRTC